MYDKKLFLDGCDWQIMNKTDDLQVREIQMIRAFAFWP